MLPASANDRAQSLVRRSTEAAESFAGKVGRVLVELWEFSRFLVFMLFVALAILNFWLWALAAVFGFLRFFLRGLMIVLLWLSGGTAPAPTLGAAIRRDLDRLWASRLVAYESFSRSLGNKLQLAHIALKDFWYWSLARKLFSLLAALAFIGVPISYLIPRPNDVRITDDNAIAYEKAGSPVVALVHAVDLHDHTYHREYENEEAWWLGKINVQGVKSQLQIGHYYRLWVVGIRWYWKPTLFPNIISATELDAAGQELERAETAKKP